MKSLKPSKSIILGLALNMLSCSGKQFSVESVKEIDFHNKIELDCPCQSISPNNRYEINTDFFEKTSTSKLTLYDKKEKRAKFVLEYPWIYGACFSWDGKRVYFHARLLKNDGALQGDILAATLKGKVTNITKTQDLDESGFDISKKGYILFESDLGLEIMNYKGKKRKALIKPVPKHTYLVPTWTCDGNFIYASLEEGSNEQSKYYLAKLDWK